MQFLESNLIFVELLRTSIYLHLFGKGIPGYNYFAYASVKTNRLNPVSELPKCN